MRLGWYDRAAPHKLYIMPKGGPRQLELGEAPGSYATRFMREMRGLGNCAIFTIKGRSVKVRARRAW